MLNIMPYRCRYCVQGFKAMVHVSDEARKAGLFLTEMMKEQAEKTPVWEALARDDPIFVNGFGHGNEDTYTGNTETPIFTSTECDILSGRIVYLQSCLTAIGLGPAVISIGGIAYGGYKVAWTWITTDFTADPYEEWYAEGFFRSSNEFPIALIQGGTVRVAKERCIEQYNSWINIWETTRSDDPQAAAVIKWLIYDRDGLAVLGNEDAAIVAIGIPTIMQVEVSPPPRLRAREPFTFSGALTDTGGNPLPGKSVNLVINGTIATTTTDGTGRWAFPDMGLDAGIYLIYVEFRGDEVYAPGRTISYKVDVGPSAIQVTVPPPSEVGVNEHFSFGGVLSDVITGAGLPSKEVNLWDGTTLVSTTTTDADGRWLLDVVFDVAKRVTLFAEFPGDPEFHKSSTPNYRVRVGKPPYFGKDTIGKFTGNLKGTLAGSIFTAPESGRATAIIAYQQWFYRGWNKCAIYRVLRPPTHDDPGDVRLIGVTEERQWKAYPEGREGWMEYLFPDPPPIQAGERYMLVQWAKEELGSDDNFKFGPWDGNWYQKDLDYNDFPDPFVPYSIQGTGLISVYCEYIPEILPEHTLKVESSPISGVPVKVDDTSIGVTPTTKKLIEGAHKVEVPDEVET